MRTKRKNTKSELQQIPGIGPSIAADLQGIGITRIEDLKGESPQALYDALCALTGQIHDRCVLYVFRCAVYYASNAQHDTEKLKWWNWKDAPR
ncbi:MAG: helix-hairpin-helix domain-containing protein [Usitatibacteraceae bacterium]